MPICGHYFWDNQYGVNLFCKKLGYDSGSFSGRDAGQKYYRESFRIGKCYEHYCILATDKYYTKKKKRVSATIPGHMVTNSCLKLKYFPFVVYISLN